MRTLCLLLLLFAPPALAAQGTTLRIRCVETCTVLLEGKAGRRLHGSQWNLEFKEVPAGKRRIEVKGVFGRSLATSYIDIPAVPEASVYVDMKGRVTVSPAAASAPPPAGEPKGQEESILQVRCQKPCTVSVDHVRRSGSTQMVTVHGLKPGPHRLEVEFVLGGGARRESIDLPPASEVFVYANEKGLQVTNTRPLGK